MVAAVALAACAVPARAETAQRAEGAVFVPADGSTVSTPLATPGGAIVQLTVSGVFAYNRTGSLADCETQDVNDALVGQTWQAGSIGLLVDGARADCQPSLQGSHDYVVNLRGTGAPLRLSIADPTGHADNSGGLTVTIKVAIDVDGACRVTTSSAVGGGGDYALRAVVMEAHQTGAYPTGSFTRITCAAYAGSSYEGSRTVEAAQPAVADTWTLYTAVGETVRVCPTVAVLDLDRTVLVQHTLPCT